jgi:ADP-ribose pyrophosphatase
MEKPVLPREIRKIFEGRVFAVQIETVTLPSGAELKAEIIRHPGSVVLIPVTDSGDVVLVRQYRPAIGRWAWELPAGSLKPGEDAETAAIRECHEEVGLVPSQLRHAGSFFPTPGYCDEEMHVYVANGLRPPRDDEHAAPDEDEDIEVKAFSRAAIDTLIGSGEIIDLKTVAGMKLLAGG